MQPLVGLGPELSAERRERFSRHLPLEGVGEEGQRRLANARVLVVGAGGLGSPILLYLAAAGVGTLGIVDSDVVDLTNLQRQVIHTTADVGRPKVTSAAEKLRALDPGANVVEYDLRLGPDNITGILAEYDIVVDATDNFPTRFLLDDAATAAGKPVVWGAVLEWSAQVAVFWSGDAARAAGAPAEVRLRDIFPTPPPDGSVPTCVEVGLMGIVPGQAGTIMAAEVVKLVTGVGNPLLGRLLMIDLREGKYSEIPLA